jgi:predicted nucleotidyltransferase component of viral defense system
MKKFPGRDPSLLERVVKALVLLEQLVECGLDRFVFKGGTSLILLLENTKRFSVDIDLCISEKPENIDDIFNEVVKKGIFKNWQKDERSPRPPMQKAHYKFFFDSHHDGKERTILLDLVFQELNYPQIIKRPISAIYVETEGSATEVQVLPIDCMLGDKLTAYAPNTCGIPYNINKDLEIIKQLYDVSKLFCECGDLDLVRRTFKKSAEVELGYRGLADKNTDDVLEDIFQTSIKIATRGKNKNAEKFEALSFGIRGFANYISEGGFTIEDAIICSSHAAYLSQLIRKIAETEIKRFNKKIDLSAVEIKGNFNYLNKLKKFSPEAFFYFKEAVTIYEEFKAD